MVFSAALSLDKIGHMAVRTSLWRASLISTVLVIASILVVEHAVASLAHTMLPSTFATTSVSSRLHSSYLVSLIRVIESLFHQSGAYLRGFLRSGSSQYLHKELEQSDPSKYVLLSLDINITLRNSRFTNSPFCCSHLWTGVR